jgi:excisionase family DNA binding protein
MESRKRSPNAEKILDRAKLMEELKKNRLFDSKEVSVILGISNQTLRRSIASGQIKTVRVGRFLRIPAAEVERLMKGEKTLLSVKEAAELLNVSAATVRILIKAGKIQALRLASRGPFKIAKSEVERIAREGA